MEHNRRLILLNPIVLVLFFILIFLAPVEFYSKYNVSFVIHRIAVITVLSCCLSFLLTLGRMDFAMAGQLAFLTSLLNVADGVWHLNPVLLILMSLTISASVGFWHYYWIDVRHIPASFITALTALFFYLMISNLFTLEKLEPYSLFFYVLALNPLSNLAIYSIIITLLFTFCILYYLRLSSRLQYNLRTDQWIPFMILVLCVICLGLAGFLRLHEYIQFRLTFFFGLLVFITSFLIERFSRIGRQIYTIGADAEVAYLAGIPVQTVRCKIWLLTSLLVGVLSFFFRGSEIISTATQFSHMQSIVLSASVAGVLSMPTQRIRIFNSVLMASCLVYLENILHLWGFQSFIMPIVNAVLFFIALYFSRFKPGQLT